MPCGKSQSEKQDWKRQESSVLQGKGILWDHPIPYTAQDFLKKPNWNFFWIGAASYVNVTSWKSSKWFWPWSDCQHRNRAEVSRSNSQVPGAWRYIVFSVLCFLSVLHRQWCRLISADGHNLFSFTLLIFVDLSVKYLNLSLKDATNIKNNLFGWSQTTSPSKERNLLPLLIKLKR